MQRGCDERMADAELNPAFSLKGVGSWTTWPSFCASENSSQDCVGQSSRRTNQKQTNPRIRYVLKLTDKVALHCAGCATGLVWQGRQRTVLVPHRPDYPGEQSHRCAASGHDHDTNLDSFLLVSPPRTQSGNCIPDLAAWGTCWLSGIKVPIESAHFYDYPHMPFEHGAGIEQGLA